MIIILHIGPADQHTKSLHWRPATACWAAAHLEGQGLAPGDGRGRRLLPRSGSGRARAQAALGIGDNIFLMTQVQAEASGRDAWHGAPAGLAGRRVITPAGFVPPGTFAVLATILATLLTELNFAIAFGILLDTTVVRSVLVTARTLGTWATGGKLAHKPDPAPPELGKKRAAATIAG